MSRTSLRSLLLRPTWRARARAVARACGAASAAMLAVSTWSAFDAANLAVSAATEAGAATLITPLDGSPGEGQPVGGGDSSTLFSIALPDGAACSGDSANEGYTVQSYMVPAAVDPGSLSFDPGGAGPLPSAFGEPYADFRQPLYKSDSSPYTNAFTANASPPPGPGFIISIPTLSFAVFGGDLIPSGTYNVGIACWGPTGTPAVDNFWNTQVTVTASAGPPATMTWSTEQVPVTTTSTTVVDTTSTSTTAPDTTTRPATTTTRPPTTTATTASASVLGVSGSHSSGLARTGFPATWIVWALLLVVCGRITQLLGR